jgi:hypothetical protein
MKSSAGMGPPKELKQLLRLRQVRVEAAELKVREQRVALETAQAVVQARHESIAADRDLVAKHLASTVGEAAHSLPRFAMYYSAFGEHLGEKLERNEYGLLDDQETLESNQSLLLEKRQLWLREQSREDGVKEALKRSKTAKAQKLESQTEDEVDEIKRTQPV